MWQQILGGLSCWGGLVGISLRRLFVLAHLVGAVEKVWCGSRVFALDPPIFFESDIMKLKLLTLSFALSCAFMGSAMAMTSAEYKAEKDRIAASYKVSKDKCKGLKDNAEDVCESEAKGADKVAKAELESKYKPTARNTEKVAMVKADTMYDTAKEKCDDLSGNAKDVCVKDAKAAHVKAKSDAKVVKTSADTAGTGNTQRVTDAKNEGAADQRQALFKAANERCDVLSGAAKDTCQNDAKAKYNTK